MAFPAGDRGKRNSRRTTSFILERFFDELRRIVPVGK
jgi:hypothetical protein